MAEPVATIAIELRKGFLTQQPHLDALVNPINTELIFGGGVAGMIMVDGGSEITAAATPKAPLRLGAVIHTPAGKLRAKHVIHGAVMGYRTEDLAVPLRDGALSSDAVLQEVTANALRLADRLACTSIGFASLAECVPGFPAHECGRVMLEAVFVHMNEHPATKLRTIAIVIADDDDFAEFTAARTLLADRERTARDAVTRFADAERARGEKERAERDKAERAEKERVERLRIERERLERERVARERADQERAAREAAERASEEESRKVRAGLNRMFGETAQLDLNAQKRSAAAFMPTVQLKIEGGESRRKPGAKPAAKPTAIARAPGARPVPADKRTGDGPTTETNILEIGAEALEEVIEEADVVEDEGELADDGELDTDDPTVIRND